MRAGIAANNPTAVESAYKRLVATVTTDDGPDAEGSLDAETVELFASWSQRGTVLLVDTDSGA
jgi:hypothetical protein